MTHEPFDRQDRTKGSSDRAFGLTRAVVFAVLAGLSAWYSGGCWPYTLSATALFALATLAVPRLLAQLAERGFSGDLSAARTASAKGLISGQKATQKSVRLPSGF